MYRMLRVTLPVFALIISAIALPVAAVDGLQPAVMTANTASGSLMPVIFKSSIRDMKVEEIVAIAAGAAIVGSVADMFFNSGLATILAMTGGAALGSYWYEEELWPFHEQDFNLIIKHD